MRTGPTRTCRDMEAPVKKMPVAVILAALSLTAAACGSSGSAGAQKGSPIEIAVIAPFSGTEGYLGNPTIAGITAALEQVGPKIDGRSVELVKEDDQCTPSTAVNIVRRLIADPSITAVFGPICTGDMSATQQMMASAHLVHVTNSYGASLYQVGDKYIFNSVDTSQQIGEALTPYIKQQAPKSAGIIHGDDAFAMALATAEKAAFEAAGVKVVYDATFDDAATDYSGQIAGLQRSGAQMVAIGAYESISGALTKQLRQLGFSAPIVDPVGCDPQATGPAGTANNNVAFALNFCPTYPAFKAFDAAYTAKHGANSLNDGVAGSYTAAYALFEGLKNSGGKGGEALRSALAKLDVLSPLGKLSFNPDGTLRDPTIITGVMENGVAHFEKWSS